MFSCCNVLDGEVLTNMVSATTFSPVSVAVTALSCLMLLLRMNKANAAVRGEQSRYIAVNMDDEDSAIMEISSSSIDFKTCVDRCDAKRDCVLVNYHSRRKTCHEIYNIGRQDTYEGVKEKRGAFRCWEKNPSKRQTPVSTTVKKETTTEAAVVTTDQAPPSASVQTGRMESTTVPLSTDIPKAWTDNGHNEADIIGTPTASTDNNHNEGDSAGTPTDSSGNVHNEGDGSFKTKTTTPTAQATSVKTPFSPETGPTTSSQSLPTSPEDGTNSDGVATSIRTVDGHGNTDSTAVIETTTHTEMGETTVFETLCERDPSHEYCVKFCRPLRKFKSIPHRGNLYTVGSKQAYDCYNQTTQRWYKHILICTEEGQWSNTDNVCNYHYPVNVTDKQMLYKFVKVKASRDEARGRCRKENADLLKITSRKTELTLKGRFQDYKGTYWTDLNRKAYGEWYTSDGAPLDQDLEVWHVGSAKTLFNFITNYPCACMDVSFLLRPNACSDEFWFVCEMIMY